MTIDTPNKTGVSQSATFTKQIMDSYDNKITKPDKTQRGVVDWMINAKKGGFDYDTLPSKGSPSQFVTITKQEMEANKVLKDAGWEMVSHSTIDNQGNISVPIGGKDVIFVNVQAQIGVSHTRYTFSHANVVADKKVGKKLIQKAMNESMGDQKSRWIVEVTPGSYRIQLDRPG